MALDKEQAVMVKLQYIHNNPVKRGLVDDHSEWIWSSYGHYYKGQCVFRVDSALT